jgi:GNAT superfamily N-acetyltransferase
LRVSRNACREGFSTDTAEISEEQQQAWWAANRDSVLAWLYQDGHLEIVGYGLLRRTEDGRWWSSVAVLPQYTGKGYGKAITADIIRACPAAVVWATARRDNPAAVKLHDLSDWEIIDGPDERLVYFRTTLHRGIPAEAVEQWAESGWALA